MSVDYTKLIELISMFIETYQSEHHDDFSLARRRFGTSFRGSCIRYAETLGHDFDTLALCTDALQDLANNVVAELKRDDPENGLYKYAVSEMFDLIRGIENASA